MPGAVDVYLSARQVAMQSEEGAPWVRSSTDLDDALAQLATEHERMSAAGGRPRRLHVWLAASLCRPVRVAPVAAALSAGELREASEASATALSGLSAPCRVWLEAPTAAGRLAVVVEERTLQMLDALAARLRVRLSSIRPYWAEVLRVALIDSPELEALALWESSTLTLLAGAGDAIAVARTMPSVSDAASAHAAFLRASVGEGLAQRSSLALGLGPAPAGEGRGGIEAFPSLASLPFGAWLSRLEARA